MISRAPNDDNANLIVAIEPPEDVWQFAKEIRPHGVSLAGTEHGDLCNILRDFDTESLSFERGHCFS